MNDILRRASDSRGHGPMGERLVSIVFANPESPVWSDLDASRGYLDARSGDTWDLFFAGVSEYAPMPSEASAIELRGAVSRRLYWNPTSFSAIEAAVVRGHRKAKVEAGEDIRPWRFSGNTDVVSFRVYNGQPDYSTLVGVQLEMPLSELTEQLKDWEAEDFDPEIYASEEVTYNGGGLPLAQALRWSATKVGALGGGLLVSYIIDLLRQVGRA